MRDSLYPLVAGLVSAEDEILWYSNNPKDHDFRVQVKVFRYNYFLLIDDVVIPRA